MACLYVTRDSVRQYIILCLWCAAGAVAAALMSWRLLPPAHPVWEGALWFTLYAALAELLAVVTDESHGVSVSLTSPILWAATCVLGPLFAIVVCIGYSVLALSIRAFFARWTQSLVSRGYKPGGSISKTTFRAITDIGSQWHSRDITDSTLYLLYYTCSGAIMVSLAGLAYHALGGVFLSQSGFVQPIHQFALPFLGLAAVSICVEHSIFTALMISTAPAPGRGSVYNALMRVRLILLEMVLPVWRGQLFLVGISLLISYLYMRIGLVGFVLTAMPVLAVRDFIRHWVAQRAAYVDTITALATYMQLHHPYTRGHLKRVADLSERLAQELKLPIGSVRRISTAGFLHDIGKISISEQILDKPGKLTEDEWAQIRQHPVKGAEIISHMDFFDGISDWIKYHHKWYDGGGYPPKNGHNIDTPIEASIIAVADAFDAMTDDRDLQLQWSCDVCGYTVDDGSRPAQCPECGAHRRRIFREPKSIDEAIDELVHGSGTQFHPTVVSAFLRMVEREGRQHIA